MLGRANPIEEYNPVTNSWTNRAMLTVGVSNSGAAAVGNYIYVPGGYDGTTARSVLQRFDPVANTVVLRASMPAGNSAHAVVAQGTKVYVLGGSSAGLEGTTNYIYNTATNTWSSGAPLPTAVEYAAAASDGTYIYVIGGRTDATPNLAVVQRYDPANNTWSGMPSLNTARGGPAAFYDGLRIWAVNGGWSGGLTSTEYFIPGSADWIPGPSTLVAARTLGAAFSPELNLAVKAGGYMADYSQDAERLPFTAPIAFSDVHPGDFFYQSVANLYCRGVISGYADNTFRPFNDTTRAQLAKIIVLAERWALHIPVTPTFSDVPTTNPFYGYVETAVYRGVISGYGDGTFRPGNNVTRGQLSKIVVLAEDWLVVNPILPTFSDVPTTNAFYRYIETAYRHGIISGYGDGTFRPGNSATRGQICKIVYGAVTQP